MKAFRDIALVVVLGLKLFPVAGADVIRLKDGRQFRGRITALRAAAVTISTHVGETARKLTFDTRDVLTLDDELYDGKVAPVFARQIEYDEIGRMIKWREQNTKGEELCRYQFYYEGGKLAKRAKWSHGKLQSRTTYSYDNRGRVIVENRESISTVSGLTSRHTHVTFSYDKEGKRTEMRSQSSDGKVPVFKYSYSEDGRQSQVIELNPDGELRRTRRFSYGKSGKPCLEVEYDAQGNVRKRTESERDDAGKLLSRETVSRALISGAWVSISQRERYEYDDEGRMKRVVMYNEQGRETGWTECTYDDKGQAVQLVMHNADGDTVIRIGPEKIRYVLAFLRP